ncbi:MAG TPA: hypothetical protein VHU19_05905, partial [Pyrinomonadaceae bacterium]|nr:hypothetical protein [Pyrinomonadaceae bacterium]
VVLYLSMTDGGLFCPETTLINQSPIYQRFSPASGKSNSCPVEIVTTDFHRTKNFLAFQPKSM